MARIHPLNLVTLALGLFVTAPLGAQTYYSSAANYTPSGTAVVITVQQPVTPLKNLRFVGFTIVSDTALTLTAERNGTSATTTLGSYSTVNPNEPAGTAQLYINSNVGVGSVIGVYSIGISAPQSVDLSYVYIPMSSASTNNNFTLRSSVLTGNVRITLVWQELTN